jgi:hypothetical protein
MIERVGLRWQTAREEIRSPGCDDRVFGDEGEIRGERVPGDVVRLMHWWDEQPDIFNCRSLEFMKHNLSNADSLGCAMIDENDMLRQAVFQRYDKLSRH